MLSDILAKVNTTATVLGYILLALMLLVLTWLIGTWLEEWHYKKSRIRHHDVEWDNVRSKWLLEMEVQQADTFEQPLVESNRKTTDVLDFTPEDIINYSKENHRDGS